MNTKTISAYQFRRYGKSPQCGMQSITMPEPGPHQLLVEVYAAGLNPIDNMIPTGMFKPVLSFTLPATLGSDLSGVVVATGSEVTRFRPGDAIYASTFDSGSGSLADYVVVNESAAALKPDNLDFIEAASLPMVSLTAWQALVEKADVQPGQKVFIPAGSGGIGTFAIQLAKQLGATVATTTSKGNSGWVSELGADRVLDYKSSSPGALLHDYDLVLATLRGKVLTEYPAMLRPGGKLISLTGPLDARFARERGLNPVITLIVKWLSWRVQRLSKRQGVDYTFMFMRPDGRQLAQITHYLEVGKIKPVIDSVYPFAETAKALAYLEQGHARGKVVVRIKAER
ncbi:NADP-dependent oxidoreductase [Pantoea sp. C2G6]|uniref:NADP-dependent oxidoreductase n=1 Tax=Pantoea sp. C2G6 TaxID=3243084 RepID=UPI003EDB56A5